MTVLLYNTVLESDVIFIATFIAEGASTYIVFSYTTSASCSGQ